MAVPDASSVIVCAGPPLTVYVTMAFGVPVKVTVAGCPEQMVWFEAMVTVGGGITVITTDPVAGPLQLGVPEDMMLTNVIVVVAE